MPPSIQITILPNTWPSSSLPPALQIYKSFRLHALKTEPRAFATTYEQEIHFSDDRWIQRLTSKDAVQFIATYAAGRDAGQDAELEEWKKPWLGSLVLVRKDGGGVNEFDGGVHVDRRCGGRKEVVFHLNAVFLERSVRGLGVGKRMMQAAREAVVEEAREKGVGWARVTTLVDSWNESAIGLYAGQGFVRKGVDEYVIDGERREAVEMECLLDIKQLCNEEKL